MWNEIISLWSITVSSIAFLLIFSLWILNVKFHYEDLKKEKAPKPLMLTIRQSSIVRWLLLPLSLLPFNSSDLDKLKGRQVWLSWDVRWVTSGSTLAKIEEVLKRPKGHALLIKLEKPMEFSYESISIGEIIFEPRDHSVNLMRYNLGAVYGGLTPSEDIEGPKNLIDHRGYLASCEIVVY